MQKKKTEGKFSIEKAHYLDANPEFLKEMNVANKKKWEERINYARTRSHLKPYSKKKWE